MTASTASKRKLSLSDVTVVKQSSINIKYLSFGIGFGHH